MGKYLVDRRGKEATYTRIPNEVLRSQVLNVYDKMVFCVIQSCDPAYPTYQTIQKWTGLSKDRVWKSLRRLEECNLIHRYERGRCVEYITYCTPSDHLRGKRKERVYGDKNAPRPVRITDWLRSESVRFTDYTGPYYGLKPVRVADPKKNKEKEQRKRGAHAEGTGDAKGLTLTELIERAQSRGASA